MKDNNETIFAGLIHLLGVLGLWIGSIVIWAVKKDESIFIDTHGKEYLNFLISIAIYTTIGFLLTFIIIGFVVLPILGVYALVVQIIATIRAFDGELYQYPYIIRFIK